MQTEALIKQNRYSVSLITDNFVLKLMHGYSYHFYVVVIWIECTASASSYLGGVVGVLEFTEPPRSRFYNNYSQKQCISVLLGRRF